VRANEFITEAANLAQQAAIAIAMKKAGKKPKSVAEQIGNPNIDEQGPAQGVAEDREYIPSGKERITRNGIDLVVGIDGATVDIRAMTGDSQMAYVVFDRDGDTLVADDLAVEEQYKGQGIAKIMYDYVKELGFRVKRSSDQLVAGKKFWDKNKGAENNIWEQGVAEDSPAQQAAIAIGIKKARKKPKNESADLTEEFDLIESAIVALAERNQVDAEIIWEDLESLTDDELYVFAVTQSVTEDWQKVNKHDRTSGMSQKAVNAYRREHPGSKLKTAVTTKPSKLKRGSKSSKRRKSYCSRSRGQMKMHHISCAKTPDKAICAARRRWNC
jgi:GNAT superfamily N-acetyltransferase